MSQHTVLHGSADKDNNKSMLYIYVGVWMHSMLTINFEEQNGLNYPWLVWPRALAAVVAKDIHFCIISLYCQWSESNEV